MPASPITSPRDGDEPAENEVARCLLISPATANAGRRAALERELALVDAKQQRLVEAITQGEALPPLVAALRGAEARKAVLLTEREALARFATVASLDRTRMERDLTALAADARGLIGRHPREARRVLQTLLVDQLECVPSGPAQ